MTTAAYLRTYRADKRARGQCVDYRAKALPGLISCRVHAARRKLAQQQWKLRRSAES